MQNPEFYIDHEVRIRLLKSILKETRYLIRAVLGVGITVIIVPIILHHYNLI